MKTFIRLCGGIVLILLLIFLIAPSMEGIAVIWHLPFGWIGFLRRTLPEVILNWAGIGMVVLCSGLILLLLHRLLNGLTGRRLPFRWSACAFIGVWLLFCLIIGVAGLSRTAALLKGEQWYERRFSRADLMSAATYASRALNDSGSDIQSLKRRLVDSSRNSRPLWEEFEFLVCPGTGGKSPSVVVIPREAKAREKIGFSIVSEIDEKNFIPISRLDEEVARLTASLPR